MINTEQLVFQVVQKHDYRSRLKPIGGTSDGARCFAIRRCPEAIPERYRSNDTTDFRRGHPEMAVRTQAKVDALLRLAFLVTVDLWASNDSVRDAHY